MAALDLTVPDGPAADAPTVMLGKIVDLWQRFVVYAISFVVLGVYWVAHHAQFRVIQVSDRPFLWINILFLMLIAFVPFATSLMGRYPSAALAVDVYGVTLMPIGGSLYLLWGYATSRHRLVPPETSQEFILAAKHRILMSPIISSTAIGVSFVSPAVSILLYAVLPPFYILPGRLDRLLRFRGR